MRISPPEHASRQPLAEPEATRDAEHHRRPSHASAGERSLVESVRSRGASSGAAERASSNETHVAPEVTETAAPPPAEDTSAGSFLLMAVLSSIGAALKDQLTYFVRGVGEIVAGATTQIARFAVNNLVLGAGKLISTLQVALGLESAGRQPDLREQQWLREVFGPGLDVDAITIKEGFAGLASLSDRPFALGNSIYLKGVTPPAADAPEFEVQAYRATLLHEAVHAWQYQHGNPPIAESLWHDRIVGDAYDWRRDVDRGETFEQLNVEQQGQLIQDAARAGYFESGRFELEGHDYTQAVEHALRILRRE